MAGDTNTPYSQNRGAEYTQLNPGPYIGIVKDNEDGDKMGGLTVLIPALAGADKSKSSGLYQVKYLSPFYGVKSVDALAGANKDDLDDYEDSQYSYGMWMIPPDIDTKVMVIFVEGRVSQGYWIGCVQDTYMNHMIPGIASSVDTAEKPEKPKLSIYGTNEVPAGELNRRLFSLASNAGGIDKLQKPVHPFAEVLRRQGLAQDKIRGSTTSSARREAPSAVFGISTPGRPDRARGFEDVGIEDNEVKIAKVRGSGHTFVMDDGDEIGYNQLVRIRTSSGHQLLMHDTAGVVYLANGSGNVWMEFGRDGTIDIYSKLGVNLRSGADINFHAEGDINMYANNNIKIKANQNYKGESKKSGQISIDGSDIRHYASRTMHNFVEEGWYATRAGMGIYSQAGTQQVHQASGQVHLVGSQVHFNSIGQDPNLVKSLQRTGFNSPYGTGTQEVNYPDVTPTIGGGQITDGTSLQTNDTFFKIDRTIPGMSGMRVPTHEPYNAHSDYIQTFPKSSGLEYADYPGSADWLAQRNRLSDNDTIRLGQYESDLENFLDETLDSFTNIDAIQDKTKEFLSGYQTKFNLPEVAGVNINPSQIGISDVSQRIIKNLTGQISPDVLFKNQPLLNQGGVIYTLGDLSKPLTSISNSLTGNLTSNIQNYATATVGSILGNQIGQRTKDAAKEIFGEGVWTPDASIFGGLGSSLVQGEWGLQTIAVDGIIPAISEYGVTTSINMVTDSISSIIGGDTVGVTEISSVLTDGWSEASGWLAESVGSFFGGGGWI